MLEILKECTICPRNCKINRTKNLGFCKCNDKIKISLYSIHKFEEPCISGKNGSGTIFFSNCNLNCIFCQNYEISQLHNGYEISINELADIFIKHQNNNAENINLVTPTMYVYHIIEAIKIARKNGLHIPIIYNTNGYETIETIKALKGYIDVYLPDFKYSNDKIAKEFSNVDNYFEVTSKAILEMYFQVGLPQFNENGTIKKGLIIRHLILPNNIDNTKNVLKWIKENLPRKTYISIMAQYFPTYKVLDCSVLNRQISEEELQIVKNYLYELEFENGYFQDIEKNELKYVPKFI